jgi:hypothetical protein
MNVGMGWNLNPSSLRVFVLFCGYNARNQLLPPPRTGKEIRSFLQDQQQGFMCYVFSIGKSKERPQSLSLSLCLALLPL